MKHVEEYLRHINEQNLYPNKYVVTGKDAARWEIREPSGTRREVLNFSSNDILGLAQDQAVKQAAIDAINRFGATNSSCTLYCGRIDLHQALEQEVSDFKQIPYTHLFLNAWMALQATTDTYCHLALRIPQYNPSLKTLLLIDAGSHSCVTAAAMNSKTRIAGALFPRNSNEVEVKPYRHCDADNLQKRIKKHLKPGWRLFVLSDAVFSTEGNIMPLPEIVDVLSAYEEVTLLVDEAHSSGSLGKTGRGIYEHFELSPRKVLERGIHPLILTTFSKFGGSVGAAISSFSPAFVDVLDAARTSSGTASLAPPLAAAALTSIRQVRQRPALVKKLHDNTAYLRNRLMEEEFSVQGDTHIICVDMDVSPKDFSNTLLEAHGCWVSPVWYIADPCVRIMGSSAYTHGQMDRLVEAMVKTREQMVGHRFTPIAV